MARVKEDPGLESDRFEDAPHPRETHVLFGQQKAERILLDAYRSGRLPHAWIIGGPEGSGKATLAWRFARFLLAHVDPAAPEVQAARDLSVDPGHHVARQIAAMGHGNIALLRRQIDTTGKKFYTAIRVDDVRAMQKLFQQAASTAGYRITIVDAADDLNEASANALLKILEEPPRNGLFLLLAHRPGLVLPTIRSRCARLLLDPLSPGDVERAIRALGEDYADADPGDLRDAARRSGGSIRKALRLMDAGSARFARQVEDLLDRLPDVDLAEAHKLADIVAPREGEERFEAFLEAAEHWLDDRVRAGQGNAACLAPYADVWEKLRASTRVTEAYNLDKRPLVLSIFKDLAAAEREALGLRARTTM